MDLRGALQIIHRLFQYQRSYKMNFNTADKVQEHYFNGKLESILVITGDKRHFIPIVEQNTDYQEYLKWVAEGNTPLPADE